MMQVEVKSGTMTKDEIQYYILLVKKRWGTRLPADLRLILEKTCLLYTSPSPRD